MDPIVSEDDLFGKRNFIIVFFGVAAILPLNLNRDMASLQNTSILSILAVIIITITICAHASVSADEQEVDTGSRFKFVETSFLAGMSSMTFAFTCHHSTFIVYKSLENNTMDRWHTITDISIGSSFLISAFIGLAGFLAFGASTMGDVLNNFADGDIDATVARLLLALTMVFTHPMELFVAR